MGTYTELITQDPQPATAQPRPEPKAQSTAPKKYTVQSPPARKQARIHASKHERKRASVHTSMHAFMQHMLAEKATNGFAFRYPPQLLEQLEDLIYEVRKRHRKKLSKNSVAVLALAYILRDYQDNGAESIVFKLLVGESTPGSAEKP